MAVADSYANAIEYRNIITKTDSGEDPEIEDDLKAVSRFLEHKLGRHFTADAADVARVYYPKGVRQSALPQILGWSESENPWKWGGGGYTRLLEIDDLSATPTSIKIDEDRDGLFTDETALAAMDYELLPQNADKGPESRPWTAVYIPNWSTKYGFPPAARVEVVGKWGWPAIPMAIKRATIHLTAVLRLESPRATREITEIGTTLGASQLAVNILNELSAVYGRRVGA